MQHVCTAVVGCRWPRSRHGQGRPRWSLSANSGVSFVFLGFYPPMLFVSSFLIPSTRSMSRSPPPLNSPHAYLNFLPFYLNTNTALSDFQGLVHLTPRIPTLKLSAPPPPTASAYGTALTYSHFQATVATQASSSSGHTFLIIDTRLLSPSLSFLFTLSLSFLRPRQHLHLHAIYTAVLRDTGITREALFS